jgi:signal transduction histidine kinase
MTESPADSGAGETRQGISTIRGQLIWAVIFPLTAFGLLTVLIITAALNNIAQNLILQRNTALAQVAADNAVNSLFGYITPLQETAQELGQVDPRAALLQRASDLKIFTGGVVLTDLSGKGIDATPGHSELIGQDFSRMGSLTAAQTSQGVPYSLLTKGTQNGPSIVLLVVPVTRDGKKQASLVGLFSLEQKIWLPAPTSQMPPDSRLLLIDKTGNLLTYTGQTLTQSDISQDGPIRTMIEQKQSQSILAESIAAREQLVVSYAPVGGSGWGLVLEEPWQAIIAPATYYEAMLAVLLVLGIVLSMVMLSVSIRRVIKPLADLSHQADELGPGSIFRPMEESGPVEVRGLFHAFNQMVIRLAEQQATLHQYAEKALLSQEEERQRISHELHDETVQDLVGLVQRVDLCRDEMDTNPAQARRRLDELSTLAEQALDDLRRISNALRPPVLQDLGLTTAVQSLCDDLTQQMPSIHCNYAVHGEEGRLPPELELAIFRVIQEALSNIRRHSHATSQVNVMLEIKEPVTIATVWDNGPSFPVQDVQTLVREGHLGLAGMYERARLFNGEISITSVAGEGTTITLSLPVQAGTITYPLSAAGQVGEI